MTNLQNFLCKHCLGVIANVPLSGQIPEYCETCDTLLTKKCAECGKEIQYKVYSVYKTNYQPDYCSECNEWKEKECENPEHFSGALAIRYKVYWEHEPKYCHDCRQYMRLQKMQQQEGNTD